MRLLILPAFLALAACSQERVQIVHPPVSLTQCDDEPTPPELPPVPWAPLQAELAKPDPNMELVRSLLGDVRAAQRQRDGLMWGYVLKFRSAFGSCKAVPAGVKEWSDAL